MTEQEKEECINIQVQEEKNRLIADHLWITMKKIIDEKEKSRDE